MSSTSIENNPLNSIYNNIIESFDGNIGHCVLLLGPELAVNQEGVGYKMFFKELSERLGDTIEIYFEEENLFAFKEGISDRQVKREIKNFYKTVGDFRLLEKIARIKFPLIINFSPDLALNKVFKENEIEFFEDHFSKSTVANNSLEKPTKQRPVLYNIFGSIEAEGSLILNHGHMHEALEKLLAERSLPDNMEAFLRNANTYIFLGFNYESWYYQLLCHRLNIKTSEQYSILSTPDCRHNDYTNRIMGKHFRMDFTGEPPIKTIDRIIETCEESSMANSDVLREIKIGGRYSLVFSYAWKQKEEGAQLHIENIVDWLENELTLNEECAHNVFRDKKNLNFGDNLGAFMDALSQCETIVQVISDAYLKSKNCMYEAQKISENQNGNRVYRILLKETENEQFDAQKIEEYKAYWKQQYDSGMKHIKENIDDAIEQGKAMGELKPILKIYEFIPQFFADLFENIHLVVFKNDFQVVNELAILEKEKAAIILEEICG